MKTENLNSVHCYSGVKLNLMWSPDIDLFVPSVPNDICVSNQQPFPDKYLWIKLPANLSIMYMFPE